MGYYNDVKACIVGPETEMRVHLVAFRVQNTEAKESFDQFNFAVADNQMQITTSYEDTKWNPEFLEIKAFYTLWNYFCYGEFEYVSGAFARIGENDDDVETIFFGKEPYDLVSVRRTIEMEYKFDDKLCGVIPL